ncbi:MAG TPA: hypothetical protein DCZ92_14020 [Elusimicrobia bacterium]|nr:MAG: hypothetical protein A2016_05410 [Elusimicrobia bacterium GWF2_62_30]HBA61898.1 hypothetical protein [Elusimicrobiota bacterium]
MRLAALVLLLLLPSQCFAFFFGGDSDNRALAGLESLRASFNAGDCAAVQRDYDGFLMENPSRRLREAAYGYLGRCYESGGLTDKAISLYKVAIGLYPDNIFFALRLGQIYNRAGFYDSAAPLFLKALDLKKDEIDANVGLARAYSGMGFLGRARDFYSLAVVLQDFNDPAVMREYARCLLKKREWGEASFIASQGRLREPLSVFWPVNQARILAGRGDYSGAVLSLDEALKLGPARGVRLERALYLLLGGRQGQAAEAADAALSEDKADALAATIKALALYSRGEKEKAQPFFAIAEANGGQFTAKLAGSFLECLKNGGVWPCKK